MIKTVKNWRKATAEELKSGYSEMILESEYTYETEFISEVALWKLKAVLNSMGLLPQVESALNSLPKPIKSTALFAWEYSPTVRSQSNTAKFVQQVLGLTDEQVENIFTEASNLDI